MGVITIFITFILEDPIFRKQILFIFNLSVKGYPNTTMLFWTLISKKHILLKSFFGKILFFFKFIHFSISLNENCQRNPYNLSPNPFILGF